MKRTIQVSVMIFILLLIMIACNNKNNNESSIKEDSKKEEMDNTLENESFNDNIEDEVLKLGETGEFLKFGDSFSITPTEFEIIDKKDSHYQPTSTYENGVYMVIDLTIENIGENTIDESDYIDYLSYYLINSNTEGQLSFPHIDDETEWQRVLKVNRFEEGEALLPGEKVTGQLFFETTLTENYSLGFGSLSKTYQNEITWNLHIKEASNMKEDFDIPTISTDLLNVGENATIFYSPDSYEFEVTPLDIEILDELELGDNIIKARREDEKIIAIEVLFKNLGETILDIDVVKGHRGYSVYLLNDNENRKLSIPEDAEEMYELSGLTDDLLPGEEVKGKLFFEAPLSDYYDLMYGNVFKKTYNSEEKVWRLSINQD